MIPEDKYIAVRRSLLHTESDEIRQFILIGHAGLRLLFFQKADPFVADGPALGLSG